MTPDALRWMGGSVVDQDREEARSARDWPLREHWEHPLACRCYGCVVDEYQPGDGS